MPFALSLRFSLCVSVCACVSVRLSLVYSAAYVRTRAAVSRAPTAARVRVRIRVRPRRTLMESAAAAAAREPTLLTDPNARSDSEPWSLQQQQQQRQQSDGAEISAAMIVKHTAFGSDLGSDRTDRVRLITATAASAGQDNLSICPPACLFVVCHLSCRLNLRSLSTRGT